ncbi:MAG TPA: hypothetical protein V6D00_11000 [Pantanalinema sp.]
MAGHSKWANIKHTKAKQDARKGAVFTEMSREIIIAARTGGSDPAGNFRLCQAIDKVKLDGVQRVCSNFELPDALMADLPALA